MGSAREKKKDEENFLMVLINDHNLNSIRDSVWKNPLLKIFLRWENRTGNLVLTVSVKTSWQVVGLSVTQAWWGVGKEWGCEDSQILRLSGQTV